MTTTTSRPDSSRPEKDASPPKILDRGSDHVAIARSLLLYGRWLAWHHPDPALVARAYQVGSPPGRLVASAVTRLRRIGSHIVEVDREPLAFAILSTTRNAVSFRLTEHLAHREVIAASGRVVARDASRTEHYVISIMRFASDAPWRLNLVEKQPPAVEVQL